MPRLAAPRDLPRELTSYDLLKTLAVVLMIADHVGAYWFPDMGWLRVAGRLCVPVWFFLVGYARSRDLGGALWAGALILVAGSMVAGLKVFPPNILFTIIVVRLALGPYMRVAGPGGWRFWAGALVLAVLALPTAAVLDYGTMALILAVFGTVCRRWGDDPARRTGLVFPYMVFCIVTYTFTQWASFLFPVWQALALFGGVMMVCLGLTHFRPATLPRLTAALPGAAAGLLRFGGRHTLAIYVIHLLLLQASVHVLYPGRFHILDWQWFAYHPPIQ